MMVRNILLVFILFLFGIGNILAQTNQQNSAGAEYFQPSALIELFSSEGCSSCPLADEFMERLVLYADTNKAPMYILDYHVHVWNKSGWIDPFSDSNYTNRQKLYIEKKGLPAMYTPQVFVNGVKDFPGGAKKDITKFIGEQMQVPSRNFMRIGAAPVENEDSLIISYKIWGKTDSLILNIAIAQILVNSQVTAGENAGKVLHHQNVVRKFKTIPLTATSGYVKISAGKYWDFTNFRVIAFIQNESSFEIKASDQFLFRKD